MTTPAQDIKVLLESDSSLALSFGEDLFVGEMPENPNLCVSLFDTGGIPVVVGPFYTCFVHILVRGVVGGYVEAYTLAEEISSVIHEYYGTPLGSSFYYTGVWASSVPFFIGTDEANRPLFSLNFKVQRR